MKNPNRVTVKKNQDSGEWMAVVYKDGKRDEAATYYTDCEQDAKDTAADMRARLGL